MHVLTNNKPRPIVSGRDLSDVERMDFDWLDADELDAARFVRFCGTTYCLEEFVKLDRDEPLGQRGWQASCPESFKSSILIRFLSDAHQAICGLALA